MSATISLEMPTSVRPKIPTHNSALVDMWITAKVGVVADGENKAPDFDFRIMIQRLCGEVGLLLEDSAGLDHSRQTVAEFWRNVASLRAFYGINSGISQIVSMLRSARFCWMERTTSREILEVMSTCLQAIAKRKEPYTDDFSDEIGDRLEAAGVDLNMVDSLKPPLNA